MKIVVWFSCGISSAVAAKLTIDKYGENNDIRIVNNPVLEEDADNRRFLMDVQKWLGVKIEIAINKKHPQCSARDIWEKRKYMAGTLGAPCTSLLKKEARFQWERSNPHDYMVLGFTVDEKRRYERFIMSERENVIPVLIDAGLTKKDCHKIIAEAGIQRPNIYNLGYPNANCIGCVKVTSPQYWNLVRVKHPWVFKDRCEQSRKIGCKLVEVSKTRIYLDELDPNETRGRPVATIDFDCGIFCKPEGEE